MTASVIKKTIVIISLFLVAIVGIRLGSLVGIYNPVPFQLAGFTSIVKWVTTNRIPNNRVATLPSNLKNFSSNNRIYLTNNYVFIPCWTGRKTLLPNSSFPNDDYCEGYLYTGSVISYDKFEGDIHQVTINVPAGKSGCIKRAMLVPEGPIAKTGPLAHWYFVQAPDSGLLDI